MRFAKVAWMMTFLGCASGRAEQAHATYPGGEARPVATVTFAAYGGQGVTPTGASEGEYQRVVLVVDLNPERGRLSQVGVRGIELTDSRGRVLATMREIISVKRLARTPKSEGWEALGAQGTSFDGTVAKEPVRLRVEAWLREVPRDLAAKVRVHLAGRAADAAVEWDAQGAVEGVWPSG